MKQKEFIIAYIEDNDLGVYLKQILVTANTIQECFEDVSKRYPVLKGVMEVTTPLTEGQRVFFSHEGQDAIQRSKKEMLADPANIADCL